MQNQHGTQPLLVHSTRTSHKPGGGSRIQLHHRQRLSTGLRSIRTRRRHPRSMEDGALPPYDGRSRIQDQRHDRVRARGSVR